MLDWELELAVVMGGGGKHISEDGALDHVFGYTILNDISERKLNATIQDRHLRPNDNFLIGSRANGLTAQLHSDR